MIGTSSRTRQTICRVGLSANQATSYGTWNTIAFDSIVEDVLGEYRVGVGFTAKETGLYLCTVQARRTMSITRNIDCLVAVDGISILGYSRRNAYSRSPDCTQMHQMILSLTAGQTIAPAIYYGGTSNITIPGGIAYTWFTVARIDRSTKWQ